MIFDNDIFMVGLLVTNKMDHTQLQPIKWKNILPYSHTITCFKTVTIKTSVKNEHDLTFQRI